MTNDTSNNAHQHRGGNTSTPAENDSNDLDERTNNNLRENDISSDAHLANGNGHDGNNHDDSNGIDGNNHDNPHFNGIENGAFTSLRDQTEELRTMAEPTVEET